MKKVPKQIRYENEQEKKIFINSAEKKLNFNCFKDNLDKLSKYKKAKSQ